MRIVIAGATGVLGRRLVRQLRARGHAVVGLARGAEGEQLVRSLGGEGRPVDLFDVGGLVAAAEGADVIVHAATSIPVKDRPSSADWDLNDRIRREGTRALTTAAAMVGARLYVQQSITWVARPPDGSFFDEDSPPYPDRLTQSALDGEQLAREAGERHGFAVAVPRLGSFYAADAGHTRRIGAALAARKLPIVGRGEALRSMLHVDDAADAVAAIVEAGRGGLWHVVDDQPAPVAEVLTHFAARLGAPPPRRVPAWLARLLAGQLAVDFLTRSIHTSNARFRRELGWTPRFPTYQAGLEQVVAAWEAEGLTAGTRFSGLELAPRVGS